MNLFDYCTQDQTLHSFTYFLNPVSGTRIMLPATSISSFSKTYAKSGITISCKAVASSVPDFPNCHVATRFYCVVTRQQHLAFCRVTDKLWMVIHQPLRAVLLSDISFYDDKLYAVGTASSVIVVKLVMIFDLRDPNALVEVLLDLSPVPTVDAKLIKDELEQKTDIERIFLVKDSKRDELLLVFHLIDYILRLDDKLSTDYLLPKQTKGFCVFKLDKSGSQWAEVDNLGYRWLFLDKQSSRVTSVTNLNGSMESIRGNCIYVALDLGCSVDPLLARDIGVFFLTDRSIKRISLNPSVQIRAPSLWFTPSVW